MLADMAVQLVGSDQKPLSKTEQHNWLKQLDGWEIKDNKEQDNSYLHKVFHFLDFEGALEFVNRVSRLAEEVNHHPELTLSWGRVEVKWWTHTLKGLHLNDFIIAAHTDRSNKSLSSLAVRP